MSDYKVYRPVVNFNDTDVILDIAADINAKRCRFAVLSGDGVEIAADLGDGTFGDNFPLYPSFGMVDSGNLRIHRLRLNPINTVSGNTQILINPLDD